MRAIFATILLVAVCFTFAGCESDVPPAAGSQNGVNKFERGISGQGSINQPDRSDDPIIRENTRGGN